MSIYNNRKPYTYLLGWKSLNKYYYGVRYSKDCNPSDLWESYFTSSKHVKNYVNVHGDPDIVQVRKVFDSAERAREWESRVLNRMDLKNDKRFLNASNNKAPQVAKFDRIKNLKNRRKYEDWDENTKQRLRQIHRETMIAMHAAGKITYEKPADRSNYISAANKRWQNSEFKSRMKKKKWMCHPTESSRMVDPELWDDFLARGFAFGRTFRDPFVV